MKTVYTTLLGLGLGTLLTMSAAALAAEPATSTPGAAPLAKPANDLRSVHLRRRAECQKLAEARTLAGEELKVFMHRCLKASQADVDAGKL